MIEKRINELVKLGIEVIGPRVKDGHCVFCQEEVEKGGYCHCKKAYKVNPQTKNLRKLIDKYAYVTDLGEFTHLLITQAHFPKKFAGMEFSDYITETEEQKHNLQLTKEYVKNALKH